MIAEYEIEPEESVIEMQPRNVDEILAELERDFEDAERLSEAESTHSAQSKTNKSSETSSSIQPKTTFQQLPLAAEFPPLPEDDYTEEDRLSPVPNDANAVPVVNNHVSSSIPEGCIVLDIDIDTNHTDQIIITPDDDPMVRYATHFATLFF